MLVKLILFSFIGDQVSKKGGMTGGFYDHRRSKLKFMNIIRQDTQSIGEKEQELERVKIKLQDILDLFSITILLKEYKRMLLVYAFDARVTLFVKCNVEFLGK